MPGRSEVALYEQLSQCAGEQLTDITARLNLSRKFLPGEGAPVATRAAAMMTLIRNSGQLPALSKLLDEMFNATAGGCILVLAANPLDADRLRTGREMATIKQRLQEGEPGRRYRIEIEPAASRADLSKYLLENRPRIVHFSGHGSNAGQIVFEDAGGAGQPVEPRTIARLFERIEGTELVVLNACYSAQQADALSKVVPYVVGMSRDVGDDDALEFSAEFYRALAYGQPYDTAFQMGCDAIERAGLPDAKVPHLLSGRVSKTGHA